MAIQSPDTMTEHTPDSDGNAYESIIPDLAGGFLANVSA